MRGLRLAGRSPRTSYESEAIIAILVKIPEDIGIVKSLVAVSLLPFVCVFSEQNKFKRKFNVGLLENIPNKLTP